MSRLIMNYISFLILTFKAVCSSIYKKYSVYIGYTVNKITYYASSMYICVITSICIGVCLFNEILFGIYNHLQDHLKSYHDYTELRAALEKKDRECIAKK